MKESYSATAIWLHFCTYITDFPSLLFTAFSILPTPFNFCCLHKLLIAFDGCEISCINFMPFWKFAQWPFKLVFCIHLERLEGWMQKMLVERQLRGDGNDVNCRKPGELARRAEVRIVCSPLSSLFLLVKLCKAIPM